MEVILKEDVSKIGKAGDKVEVKDGYARNYLIPKGLALGVTAANEKVIQIQREKNIRKEEEVKAGAEAIAKKLEEISCTIAMNVGEDDKLFGAVTTADVAATLSAEGVVIDKKDIVFEDEMPKLGIYYFKVKLHPEVTQRVKLWVVKK